MTSTILVIDGDTELRGSLAEALRDTGYLVTTARNGTVGLALLRGIAIDLVLLDIGMVEATGRAFLDACAAAQPPDRPPVILMSASEWLEVPAEGWVSMLAKPFSLQRLLEVVRRSLAAATA